MYEKVPGYVVNLSRQLRQKTTPAEDKLWQYLRNKNIRNLKFRRQYPIGRYIADFYCDELKLIIELDGEIHNHIDVKEYDIIRNKTLLSKNYKILRFKNEDVLNNINTVISIIKEQSHLPSPQRRGAGGEV